MIDEIMLHKLFLVDMNRVSWHELSDTPIKLINHVKLNSYVII